MDNTCATFFVMKGGEAMAIAAATYMVIVCFHNAHTALREFKVHSACTLHALCICSDVIVSESLLLVSTS